MRDCQSIQQLVLRKMGETDTKEADIDWIDIQNTLTEVNKQLCWQLCGIGPNALWGHGNTNCLSSSFWLDWLELSFEWRPRHSPFLWLRRRSVLPGWWLWRHTLKRKETKPCEYTCTQRTKLTSYLTFTQVPVGPGMCYTIITFMA